MEDAKICDEELLRKLDSAASPEVSGMLNRYFVAALCESAAARLRFKDAAIDNLAAEVERLEDRFDAVRDAAHAEAKRVFPDTVIESHFGGELHADDLCSMLAAEVERLRGALSIYASPTSWACEAELSIAGCPDKCIFWYRSERGHGYEIAKSALSATPEEE